MNVAWSRKLDLQNLEDLARAKFFLEKGKIKYSIDFVNCLLMRFKIGQSWQKLLTKLRTIFLENQTYPHIHCENSHGAEVTKKGSKMVVEAAGVAYLRVPTPSSARRRDRRLEYRLTTVSAGFRFSFPPSSRSHNYFRDSSYMLVVHHFRVCHASSILPAARPAPSDIPVLLSPPPLDLLCCTYLPLHLFTYACQ